MLGPALLAVDGLTVERGGRLVLSALCFALAPGETLVVRGRNGAGKSTLLRAVAGLLPIEAGRLLVRGAGDEVRPAELIHYLGYEDALKPSLTVRENLHFWAAMLATDVPSGAPGLPPGEALATLGVGRLLDLPAGYLSAGQKRRVALARLLLARRPVWLLDEPTIALDAGAQEILAAVMARHVGDGGGILAASHAPLGVPCRTIDLGVDSSVDLGAGGAAGGDAR